MRDGQGVQSWPDGAKYEGTPRLDPFEVKLVGQVSGRTTKLMARANSIM